MDYKAGDRVRHPVFGDGTVLRLTDAAVVVQFDALAPERNIRVDYESLAALREQPGDGGEERAMACVMEAISVAEVLRSYVESLGDPALRLRLCAMVDAITRPLRKAVLSC